MLMINVISYYKKQSNNLSSIEKSGQGYTVKIKKFDPDTGLPVKDEIIPLTLNDAQQRQLDLQDELTKITNFINDLQALT